MTLAGLWYSDLYRIHSLWGDKLVTFQVPNESVINHTFHNFANTAGESKRTVTGWIFGIFVTFWYWNNL